MIGVMRGRPKKRNPVVFSINVEIVPYQARARCRLTFLHVPKKEAEVTSM